jgi:hypothetical protein
MPYWKNWVICLEPHSCCLHNLKVGIDSQQDVFLMVVTCGQIVTKLDDDGLSSHGESVTLMRPVLNSAPVTDYLECCGIHAIHGYNFLMNFCSRNPFGKQKTNH